MSRHRLCLCVCPAAADGEEEAGPGASGRTGNEAAGGESDGGGTDQPRKRKAVRFEQYDDKAFEDLMRMQEVRPRGPGLWTQGVQSTHGVCRCGVCIGFLVVLVHSCAPG
jgi:hypothetical protein